MRVHRLMPLFAILASIGLASAARAAAPEILSVVPKDAWVVVALRDLNAIDAKARKLMTDMKMIAISPLMYAKGQMLEIVEGIDDAGTAALVVLPTESGKPDFGGRDMVILVPTTDRTKLTQFIKPEPLPDDPDYLKVIIKGQESYLGIKGKYSVIGSSLDRVKSVVRSGDALGPALADHQVRMFAEGDVCVLLRPAAMLAGISEPDAAMGRGAAALGMTFEDLKTTKALVLSARLDEKGLRVEASTQRGSAIEGPREHDGSLLRGLAAEKYVLAMGAAGPLNRPAALDQYFKVVDETDVINADRRDAFKSAVGGMWNGVQEFAVSVVALPEGPDGLVGLTMLVRTAGPTDSYLRRIERLVSVLKEGAFVDPKVNAGFARLSYRAAVENASDGAKLDQLHVDLGGVEGVDDAMVKRAIGRDGVLVRMTVVDGSLAVIGFGGGLARFEQAVAAARSGDAKLAADPGIAASAPVVPAKRTAEGYLALDRGLGVVRSISKALDVKNPAPAMADLAAPIVFAAHRVAPDTDGASMFVPYAAIIAIKGAATDAAASMIGAAAAGAGN